MLRGILLLSLQAGCLLSLNYILSKNLENLNAVFIEHGMSQSERLVKLNQIAIHQMSVLESGENDIKLLK